jgi:hypothetical protein
MALDLFKRVETRKGLFAVEKITLIYNLLTSILILFLFQEMDHPVQMLADRAVIAGMTFLLMYLYRLAPCKFSAFIRIVIQMSLLSYWYPDSSVSDRIINFRRKRMRLGQAAMEALRAEITGCLKPGDELVVACPVALKGTSVIAKNKKDKLAERFSAGFIQNCVSLWDAYGAGSIVWKIAQEADASALYAMGEGGFLSALWKMAEASEVGLEADFRKVPIRQETIEVCEIFDLNPYKLQADGAVLIGIRGGEALVQRLRNEGFMAEVIGQTNSGNDRLLYSGGSARYLERPTEDELQQLLKE